MMDPRPVLPPEHEPGENTSLSEVFFGLCFLSSLGSLMKESTAKAQPTAMVITPTMPYGISILDPSPKDPSIGNEIVVTGSVMHSDAVLLMVVQL